MQRAILFSISIILLGGCMSTKQIGKVNMISNRNNDSNAEYESIQNYVGGSNQELRRFKAPTLEQAIDNVVRNVPGGEYLKNVKIYVLNGKYFAVEGDVWGFRRGANFKGFKVGDKVQWKEYLRTESGIIVDLKDDLTCTVKIDGNGKFKVIKYTELLRSDE